MSYAIAQQRIAQAKAEGWTKLDLAGLELEELPPELWALERLEVLVLGKYDNEKSKIIGNNLRSLPPEIRQLSNLQTLFLLKNQLSSLPDAIGNLTNLKTLHLSSNKLRSLSPKIGNLTNLKTLSLWSNQLSSLPDAIVHLANLQTLDLGYNQLSSLPDAIGNLTNLQTLELRGNQLSSLPDTIGNLTSLQTLELRGNKLRRVPLAVRELTQLETLNLYNCGITTLPEWIRDLPNLKKLDLRANLLPIPPELLGLKEWYKDPGDLQEILNFYFQSQTRKKIAQEKIAQAKAEGWTELDLAGLELEELPPELWELSQLKVLVLGKWDGKWMVNKLKSLPDAIGNLTNLQTLDLRLNQLSSLPDAIGNLTNLKELNLSSNQLSSLPDAIGNLTNLQTLSLSSNQLSSLPDAIGNLTNLQTLELRNNKLRSLPAKVVQLTNLKTLALSRNQLRSLPAKIVHLTNLQKLNLGGNKLSSLPAKIVHLTNLQELNLGENKLSSLPPEIIQLTNLQQLHLGGNQLRSLPSEIGKLNNLKMLDLHKNKLGCVPLEVRELPQLETLNLCNCGITTLPEWIRDLPNLKKLDLRENPLPIPPELLGPEEWYEAPGDLEAILSFYFQSQTPEAIPLCEAVPLYEAKVLIVGEPGAGKTSLVQKLLNPNYALKEHEASTQGIEVLQWEFTQGNGKTFRARLWDFGRQEIYHQTHQFFLSKRSLYILVADDRKEDTNFYDWLNTVQLLGGDSPVIIVKNEKHDRQRDINERGLRGEFLQLEKVFAVNLATNRGLAALTRYLQCRLVTLDHVGTALPPHWPEIRAILEDYTKNHNTLDRDQYYGFCRQQNLTDTTEMLRISDYLHDLGICLHFQREPALKHLLILKPEWSTAAAYKILDNTKIRNNLGHFTTADLEELWTGSYAPYRDELLELMQKFKLCYEIPHQPGHYIAPQLLSEDQPYDSWDDSPSLRLRYQYAFMPKGIVSRLIVELHEYIAYQAIDPPKSPLEKGTSNSVPPLSMGTSDPPKSPLSRVTSDSVPPLSRGARGDQEEALVWKTGVVVTNGSALAEIKENYPQRTIEIRVRGNRQRDWLLTIAHELDKIHASYNRDLQKPGQERLKVEKLIPCNCDRCSASPDPEFYPKTVLDQYWNDRRPNIECRKSYDRVNVYRLLHDVINEIGSVDNAPSQEPLELLSPEAQATLDQDLLKFLESSSSVDQPDLPQPPTSALANLDPQLAQVLNLLSGESLPLDLIIQKSQLPAPIVSSALLQLELLSLVIHLPGMRYQRCNSL